MIQIIFQIAQQKYILNYIKILRCYVLKTKYKVYNELIFLCLTKKLNVFILIILTLEMHVGF